MTGKFTTLMTTTLSVGCPLLNLWWLTEQSSFQKSSTKSANINELNCNKLSQQDITRKCDAYVWFGHRTVKFARLVYQWMSWTCRHLTTQTPRSHRTEPFYTQTVSTITQIFQPQANFTVTTHKIPRHFQAPWPHRTVQRHHHSASNSLLVCMLL